MNSDLLGRIVLVLWVGIHALAWSVACRRSARGIANAAAFPEPLAAVEPHRAA